MKYKIYKITNLVNGKIYIGSTIRTMAKRWSGHLTDVKKGSQAYFHKAIRKYGPDQFKYEVIFVVIDRSRLEELESYFIELYNSKVEHIGYNQHDPILGNSLYVGEMMKKEWSDPNKKAARIESMVSGSKKQPLVAVNIDNGSVIRYESVHAAMREGYAASSIYNSLNRVATSGQKNVWFYDEGQSEEQLTSETLQVIGSFNINNTKIVQSHDLKTGVKTIYNTISDVRASGYTPKQVNRVLSGKRKTFDNKTWCYLD
jgi:hypothetical protein